MLLLTKPRMLGHTGGPTSLCCLYTSTPGPFSANLLSSKSISNSCCCKQFLLPRWRTLHLFLMNLMTFLLANSSHLDDSSAVNTINSRPLRVVSPASARDCPARQNRGTPSQAVQLPLLLAGLTVVAGHWHSLSTGYTEIWGTCLLSFLAIPGKYLQSFTAQTTKSRRKTFFFYY